MSCSRWWDSLVLWSGKLLSRVTCPVLLLCCPKSCSRCGPFFGFLEREMIMKRIRKGFKREGGHSMKAYQEADSCRTRDSIFRECTWACSHFGCNMLHCCRKIHRLKEEGDK